MQFYNLRICYITLSKTQLVQHASQSEIYVNGNLNRGVKSQKEPHIYATFSREQQLWPTFAHSSVSSNGCSPASSPSCKVVARFRFWSSSDFTLRSDVLDRIITVFLCPSMGTSCLCVSIFSSSTGSKPTQDPGAETRRRCWIMRFSYSWALARLSSNGMEPLHRPARRRTP